MNEARNHKIIVVLVVASSLCATLLISMLVLARGKQSPGASQSVSQRASGGSNLPPGGVAPITPVADPETTTKPAKANKPPPELYPAPAFSFTERGGATVSQKDLAGKIVIADFIFTRCGTICPRMTQQMAAIQGKLIGTPTWNRIRLVSFSVDPDFDTPDILTDYAKRFDADPTHWLFLTGKRKEMWTMITGGFKLPVADNTDDGLMPILHSEKFVLIDAEGKIRGYYDGLLDDSFSQLLADTELLASGKR